MKYFEYNLNNNVVAITTTREIGNMAYQVGDNKEDVINNRNKVIKDLNINKDHLVFVHQSHSDIILETTNNDLGKGQDDFISGMESDALYTKEKGIALGIFHADCVPVFFSYEDKLVGIIHSGHIGTLKHITYKSISKVINKEKLNPNNIKVAIGPHRMKDSYYVGIEGKEEIISNNGVYEDGYFNELQTVINDLVKCNIPLNNINCINIDTVTSEETYSAYKKTPVGRMASIIMLK